MAAEPIDLQAWKGRLQSSKQGYKKNMTNLMMFMKNVRELGNTIRWNEFSQRIEWNGIPLEDHQIVDIRLILEGQGFEPNDKDILPAVVRQARENSFHPVREYLRSLKWDGTKRLHRWLQDCLGVPDSSFVRAVGRKTLISAVARIFQPGCKVDTMLVLEGPQGIRKSSAVSALFSERWTAESVNLFDQHNKMVMVMMGAWCIELAEFVALQKKDQNSVKGMISMKSDRVVLSYGRIATDHPRQCIFIGTINPDNFGYLTDSTGNRRYWPVHCTAVNLELIKSRRDQLWAEAVRAFDDGEKWWLESHEEALASTQVKLREEADIWEEVLSSKVAEREKQSGCPVASLTVSAALQMVGVPTERMGKVERNRIGAVLRRLGFTDIKVEKDENRGSVRAFARPT